MCVSCCLVVSCCCDKCVCWCGERESPNAGKQSQSQNLKYQVSSLKYQISNLRQIEKSQSSFRLFPLRRLGKDGKRRKTRKTHKQTPQNFTNIHFYTVKTIHTYHITLYTSIYTISYGLQIYRFVANRQDDHRRVLSRFSKARGQKIQRPAADKLARRITTQITFQSTQLITTYY